MSALHTYLGPKGYSILKQSISTQEQNKIRNDLTVKPFAPPNSIQKPKPFTIYRESPKKLYVPRMYGLEKYGKPSEIKIPDGETIDVDFNGSVREYQTAIINAYLKEANETGCGLLEIPCGRGKCLGYNTEVLMADNSIKYVQDIVNGEYVMGDTFEPRKVHGVTQGHSTLYKIEQDNGMTYVVNDVHILTLYNSFTQDIEDIHISALLDIERTHTNIRNQYLGVRRLPNNTYVLSAIRITRVHNDTRYYGFMIGGNHRFLLGDCTITHNTVMALNIISQLKKKTLVIVHKEFLMNQWIERIQQFLPTARIGKIQGPIVDIENKDIVLGMLQSLSMKEYPASTFASFGLTISDECFPAGTKVLTDLGFINIETLREKVNKVNIISYNHATNMYEMKALTHWFEKPSNTCIEITYMVKKTKGFYASMRQNESANGYTNNENMNYVYSDTNADMYTDVDTDADDEHATQHTIQCTHKHRVYLCNQDKYVYAETLKKGDTFLGLHYQQYEITYIKHLKNTTPLYDIEVKDNHNFFVSSTTSDSILVHNCHHISAEVFCRSLFKVVTKYMLGLSATMNRKDGLTKVFKYFIGNVAYKEKREGDNSVQVQIINYSHADKEYSETVYNFKGQVHYAIMIRNLCEFNHRTEFILKVLQNILSSNMNEQIMIIAHNKSILKYIHDAIEHRNIATVGYYVGGMKETALKETESKQVVIATYAMAEEALDIKTLSCLIMATPKTDVTQAVGRILRMKHTRPLVVDIVDQHGIFQRQSIKRLQFYKKCKYTIMETDSNEYFNNKWKTLYSLQQTKQMKATQQKETLENIKIDTKQTKIEDLIDIKIKKSVRGPLLQGVCLL